MKSDKTKLVKKQYFKVKKTWHIFLIVLTHKYFMRCLVLAHAGTWEILGGILVPEIFFLLPQRYEIAIPSHKVMREEKSVVTMELKLADIGTHRGLPGDSFPLVFKY